MPLTTNPPYTIMRPARPDGVRPVTETRRLGEGEGGWDCSISSWAASSGSSAPASSGTASVDGYRGLHRDAPRERAYPRQLREDEIRALSRGNSRCTIGGALTHPVDVGHIVTA